MRSKVLIGLSLLLVLIIGACGGLLESLDIASIAMASSPPPSSSGIMIVFYRISDGLYFFWCDVDAEIVDNGDGTWDVTSNQGTATGINQATVTYDYYKYQDIKPLYDEEGNPLPIYIEDLNLVYPDAGDLPQSRHVAALKAVYMVEIDGQNYPRADIWRLWNNAPFLIEGCRVSQLAYDQYTDGKIELYDNSYDWLAPENANCFVAVDFIHENFTGEEVTLPIVDGKLLK